MGYGDDVEFSALFGKTLTAIDVNGIDEIKFTCSDGSVYRMFHRDDCCESVTIDDIAGALDDLIGEPILLAEEVTHDNENPKGVEVPNYQDSYTWTFYKLATNKGYATIRWYGESNGYYSEEVNFVKM